LREASLILAKLKPEENPCNKILSVIIKYNGCRWRDIQREFPLPNGSLDYYLKSLVEQGKIFHLKGRKYYLPNNEVKLEENPCDRILSVISKYNGCRLGEIQRETSFTRHFMDMNLNLLLKQGKILRFGKAPSLYKYFLPEMSSLLKKCVLCRGVITKQPILKNVFFPDEIYCSDNCKNNSGFLSIADLEQISDCIEELKQSGIKRVVNVPKIHEFTDYLQQKYGFIEHTFIQAKEYIQNFFKFLGQQDLTDISSITKGVILAFLRESLKRYFLKENLNMRLFYNAVSRRLSAITKFFNFCLEEGKIEKNPMEDPSAIREQIKLWFK
jgi:hypothetical protein